MARCIAQVTIPRDTQIPADAVVNTWHFESDDGFDTDAPGLNTRLKAFYQAISGNLSVEVGPIFTFTYYDWSDDKPRVPKLTDTLEVVTGSGGLPSELAVCLSMEGAQVSGGIKARRRGRIYLGPMSDNTLELGAGFPGEVAVKTSVRTTILDAAEEMATGGAGTFRLAVFSPTTKATGGTDDEAWNDVTKIWIDNAWDIQRRRGAAATSRLSRDI